MFCLLKLVINVVVFACVFLAQDTPWTDASSTTDDAFDFTFIRNESGHIIKVAVDQAPNDTAVPLFTANEDTRFELFTWKNPTQSQLLLLDNSSSIENSNFDSKLDTRVFIHGWYENRNRDIRILEKKMID